MPELNRNNATTVEELVQKLNSSHSIVYHYIQQFVKDAWTWKIGSETNHKARVDICISLPSYEYNSPFLDRFMTDDEKYIFYKNMKQYRQ